MASGEGGSVQTKPDNLSDKQTLLAVIQFLRKNRLKVNLQMFFCNEIWLAVNYLIIAHVYICFCLFGKT